MSADPAPWRRQSNQISGGGVTSPPPGPPPGAPPPPPPYATAAAIPSVRIPTEIGSRKEPPAAIQNAMMTKDKKPFTYTPGGLDLAEIRSPRMAKRISRNAHLEDRYDQADGLAQHYQQQVPIMQQAQSPIPHQTHMPMSQQQMAAMAQQQMAMAQTPRGWSPVSSPPVQSRSFRVLQKITGSDQEEAPVYSEMMSPPVYTMPPSYPPSFYSMRSPTYDNNAGQDGGGGGNYWVWDANSQTYVPNTYPTEIPRSASTPTPCDNPSWQWEGEGEFQSRGNQDGQYPPYDYWNYPPQNEEEQRQFWEHYGQMCAYLAQLNAAACRYSPYPCPPMPYPSDSDECGYSSNDEMTYYGQMFKQRAQNYMQQNRPVSAPERSAPTPKANEVTTEEIEEDSESTDTETDIVEREHSPKNGSDESDTSEDASSQGCTEIPHQLSVIFEETEPQSEVEGKISVQPSDDEDSSTTLENDSRKTSADNTSSDTENSVVRVRLPLKFKFSQSNNDEQVTTVIVGDSEVESSPEVRSEDIWSPTPERVQISPSRNFNWSLNQSDARESSPSPDVTVTINLNRKKTLSPIQKHSKPEVFDNKQSDDCSGRNSPVDFWKELKDSSDEDATKLQDRKDQDESPQNWDNSSSETSIQTIKRISEEDYTSGDDDDDESDSESSDKEVDIKQDENNKPTDALLKPKSDKKDCNISNHTRRDQQSSEDESESDSDSSEDNPESKISESSSNPIKSDSIRRNIDLLMFKESIDNDKSREGDESDNDDSSDSDSSCANLSLDVDAQNEEAAEEQLNGRALESEEDDSGVTSDLSRHISETDTDPECVSELSKMTRYQRAATHSRLFKLLQDECSGQDESEDEEEKPIKRERLTLPLVGNVSKSNLSSDQESSSSGINSPMSPAVNERLVKELVQSLLSRKKSRHFRKLPIEKLYAAAARILQEDMDYDTGSTSDDSNMFLSPCDNPIPTQGEHPGFPLPNPENYGENYYDYCDYYSSWADAAYYSAQPSYDILPSKTFRTLRETTENEKNRLDFSLPVRCPKLSLPTSISKEPIANTVPPET